MWGCGEGAQCESGNEEKKRKKEKMEGKVRCLINVLTSHKAAKYRRPMMETIENRN